MFDSRDGHTYTQLPLLVCYYARAFRLLTQPNICVRMKTEASLQTANEDEKGKVLRFTIEHFEVYQNIGWVCRVLSVPPRVDMVSIGTDLKSFEPRYRAVPQQHHSPPLFVRTCMPYMVHAMHSIHADVHVVTPVFSRSN